MGWEQRKHNLREICGRDEENLQKEVIVGTVFCKSEVGSTALREELASVGIKNLSQTDTEEHMAWMSVSRSAA